MLMRQALRPTLPSSCLAPPNSSGATNLGTAVPLLAYRLGWPPDPYGLIGMVQTVYCYYFTAHSTTWTLDPEAYPFEDRPHHILDTMCTWASAPLALRITFPDTSTHALRLTYP